jgi:hypothetical protein
MEATTSTTIDNAENAEVKAKKKTGTKPDTNTATEPNIAIEGESGAELITPQAYGKHSYIYIGPGVPGGALPSNRIIKGTREEVETLLADVIAAYPKVKSLVVPVGKLAVSKVKVKKTDNILGKNYEELKEEFTKGGVNNGV